MYLGIDFGTSTNHIVTINLKNGEVKSVPVLESMETDIIPNSIYYSSDDILIGKTAENKHITDPLNLVRHIKRKIGDSEYFEFIKNIDKELSAKEIATDIFRVLKAKIESKNGGEKIEGAVLTVPYDYLHGERKSIKESAEAAGIKIIGLVEEPLAAAIKYCDDINEEKCDKNIMIFDLGGGTLDITILNLYIDSNIKKLTVLNTDGDKKIGGRYIDESIYNYITTENGVYFEGHEKEKLLEEIKSCKEALLEEDESEVSFYGRSNEIEYMLDNELIEKILSDSGMKESIADVIENSLIDINLTKDDLSEVVMVGGASKLRVMKLFVKESLEGVAISDIKECEKTVGYGAGVFGKNTLLNKENFEVEHALNHPVGIDKNGFFIPLISKNSKYNIESSKTEFVVEQELIKLSKKDENKNVESDKKEFYLEDEVDFAEVEIYQGDSKFIKNCSKVGVVRFDSKGIKGKIAVTLLIDEYGLIRCRLYNIDESNEYNLVCEKELD